jgi:hypothetical protein
MVQRLGEFSSATMRQYPGGMSFVHLVREGTGLPDAEARGALVALAKRFEYDVGPTAVVVGGECAAQCAAFFASFASFASLTGSSPA